MATPVPNFPLQRKCRLVCTTESLAMMLGLPPNLRIIAHEFHFDTQTMELLVEGDGLPERFAVPEGGVIRQTCAEYAPRPVFMGFH